MATPPFKYQAPFPMGKDTTEYYLGLENFSMNQILETNIME